MGLKNVLDAVDDRTTFTADFLEAALAATSDHEGMTDFLRQPSWEGFATFLYLGLIYE